MIIDAHNHPDWHGHNLRAFVRNMEKHEIDVTWLLSWEAPEHEYDPAIRRVVSPRGRFGPISFANCLAYAESHPEKFVLGYAPDPRRPEALDMLRAAIDLHGVRIYGELKLRMTYDNPDALRMFRFCGEADLPVVVHIDYAIESENPYPRSSYWYGGGVKALERALDACPETVFLGHGPGFWAHISGDDQFASCAYPGGSVKPGGKVPDLLRTYPRLYCDLSAGSGLNALQRDRGFALDFVLEFQDRLLFARDYFDGRLYNFLKGLDLPQKVEKKIFCANALELVPLD